MHSIHKLYLSLGLLFSMGSDVHSYQKEFVGIEITKDLHERTEEADRAQEEINRELYDLFSKFFNENDTMPFSKIVGNVITILKAQKNLLEGDQQVKCEEVIKSFEKHKYNYNFPAWARILIAPELLDLLSQETRTYLNSISNHVKIRSLINKLKK